MEGTLLSPRVKTALRDCLARVLVKDVVKQTGPVIAIECSMSLLQAYELLAAHGIESAPVVKDTGGYVGLLDIRSLLRCVEAQGPATLSVSLRSCVEGMTSPREIMCPRDVVTEYMHTAPQTASLLSVCDVLKTGVRRVVITDESGTITAIASQSLLLRSITIFLSEMGDAALDMTLSDLGFDRKTVWGCTPQQPVGDALKLMSQFNISAIAVVNADSQALEGEIGALDLLNQLHSGPFNASTPISDLAFPIKRSMGTVRLSDSLRRLLQQMESGGRHRVFVLAEGSEEVIGVISLKDVLSVLLPSA